MSLLGGDVAQLVEHRTGTPLTQVRFPGTARDFLLRASFQCRLYFGVLTPPCAIACINICAYDKDHVVHRTLVRCSPSNSSSMDDGNTKTPSMHRRWGCATLSQLASPGKATQFLRGEIPMGQYSGQFTILIVLPNSVLRLAAKQR